MEARAPDRPPLPPLRMFIPWGKGWRLRQLYADARQHLLNLGTLGGGPELCELYIWWLRGELAEMGEDPEPYIQRLRAALARRVKRMEKSPDPYIQSQGAALARAVERLGEDPEPYIQYLRAGLARAVERMGEDPEPYIQRLRADLARALQKGQRKGQRLRQLCADTYRLVVFESLSGGDPLPYSQLLRAVLALAGEDPEPYIQYLRAGLARAVERLEKSPDPYIQVLRARLAWAVERLGEW